MKKLIIFGIIVFLSSNTEGYYFNITNVSIVPPQPDISDIITIDVDGSSGNMGVTIDNTFFTVSGNDLQLDIYATCGALTVPVNWEHLEQIGTLGSGDYDLTVNVYGRGGLMPYPPYTLDDIYYESFTVIPEPATILLFGLGAALLKKRRLNV